MDRNFRKESAPHGADASPPSEAWLFAQALLGKPVPSASRAQADARARREHLEWLAQISPEDARRVRGQLSEEAEAKAQRELLEWLADISPEHEVKLRSLQRAEAEARESARALGMAGRGLNRARRQLGFGQTSTARRPPEPWLVGYNRRGRRRGERGSCIGRIGFRSKTCGRAASLLASAGRASLGAGRSCV